MSLHDFARLEERLVAVADPVRFLVNLFAHAPVGFAVWNADGRPLLTNKAFLDIFGSEPPPGYNVLQDDVLEKSGMLALFRRAFAGETVQVPTFWYDPRELETVTVTEGRRVAISMTIFPLFKQDGSIDVVAATYKDDTELMNAGERSQAEGKQLRELLGEMERHNRDRESAEAERARLEAQLRQSQKMEALGTLAGGIAHDFNNLLTVIVGGTKIVRDDIAAGAAAAELDELLADVQTAGVRASELVRRILAFARPQEATRRAINVGPILNEAAALLRATVPAMIAIKVDVAAELPAIHADAIQLHQVIMNLANNAAHAIGARRDAGRSSSGTITIAGERVELDEDAAARLGVRSGKWVKLTVGDDGSGIDPAIVERIFEPFFTTKPAHEGSGLGLSVVHGIVKGHGGSIAVESALGKGTSFQLLFPAVEQSTEVARDLTSAPRGDDEHVLLVDDEEALVYVTTRILRRRGYRVTSHTDSAKALLDFRARPSEFDAVITDLSMPSMSGLDLAQRMREVRPELPVLVMSGYFRPEDRAAADAAGVRELLLKPNTIDELAAALQRALGKGPAAT